RAIVNGEDTVVPRVSDLPYVVPTLQGKVEFETVEDGREDQIIEKLIQGAVAAVFNRSFNVSELEPVIQRFKAGVSAEVGDMVPSAEYVRRAKEVGGVDAAVAQIDSSGSPGEVACAVEFLLEGLHLNKRLNKDR